MVLSLGERIISLREKKNWNQKELAHEININVSVMNRIEKGTRPLTDIEIVKIAEVFEVSTDYLLTGKDYHHEVHEVKQLLRSGNATTVTSDGNTDIEKRIERIERTLRLHEGRQPEDTQN